jgi:hypothetical protein
LLDGSVSAAVRQQTRGLKRELKGFRVSKRANRREQILEESKANRPRARFKAPAFGLE